MSRARTKSALALALASALVSACDGAQDAQVSAATPSIGSTAQALAAPPVNSLPSPQTTNEDSRLIFSSFGLNPLSVSDEDSPISTVQITVTHGTFTVRSSGVLNITGNGTFSVILTGATDAINEALDGAFYSPAPNYSGPAELQMNSSDNDGGKDFDVLSLTVSPFNDPPTNNVPAAPQNATEDVPRAFNFPVSDVDVGTSPMTVSLTSSNGSRITLPTTSGLSFSEGTGTLDVALTFTGTLPNINAALNGLVVTPTENFIGTTTLVLTSNDQHATGEGEIGTDTDTVTINWAPVNDAPVNVVPPTQPLDEETLLTFSTTKGNGISVGDVDATTAMLQVTLSAQGGTLKLSRTAGLGFSAGDGTADATMTFSGTLVNLNAALEGLEFNPNANFAGTAQVKVTTNDLGNSGAGGALQDSDTVAVEVAGVNDAPQHTVPPAQTTNEDVARAFTTTNGNLISVADVDAPTLQVTLTAVNGTLTLGQNRAGLSYQAGDGVADATMTVTGTGAALNGALNGLTFIPTPNYSGAASVSIHTTDLGATGSGEVGTADSTIAIQVNPVNDPPTAVADSVTVAEDSGATTVSVLTNDTTVPDVGETLTISTVGPAANGTVINNGASLSYQPNANFNGRDSFSYTVRDDDGGTATATVSVTVTSDNDQPVATDDNASVAQNASAMSLGVLANDSTAPDVGETLTLTSVTSPSSGGSTVINGATITYTPAAGFTGFDTFTYSVSDGNGGSATATVTVTVTAVYDSPINTLPAPQHLIEDTQLLFSAAGGNPLTVTDANDTNLTVRLTVSTGTLALTPTSGMTVTANGSASVTLQGTLSALNAGLNTARYTPPSNYNGSVQLTVTSSDSLGKSDTDLLVLTVSSVNDVPLNTVPTALQAATEDTPKTFTTLQVADVDVGSGQLRVTLTANNGTVVSLANTSSVAFAAGDGVADTTTTFEGTPVQIASALNGLTVTPAPNYVGQSTLTLVTNDMGNTGSGGEAQDTDVVTINWVAANDAPIQVVPAAQTMPEEGTFTFAAASGTGLSVTDADVGAGELRVTLSAGSSGRVSLGSIDGITLATGTGTLDPSVIFTGTQTAVNAALEGASFVPNVNFVGNAVVTLTTSDQGNTGGAAKTDTDTVTIAVTGVNDAPVNTVPGNQSIAEDGSLLFATSTGNPVSVADVDAATLQVTLSALNGTVAIATKTNLIFQVGTGSAAPTMTFTGPVSSVNAALNTLRFAPNAHFGGGGSVTIHTADLGATGLGGALTDTDTVLVNVMPANDNPTAVADTLTLEEDAPATTIDVLGNDSDAPDVGETLTLTAVSVPAHGTATRVDGQVVYQPTADYAGPDSFTYTIADGNGGVASATVTVTVTPVNDAPTAVADTFSISENAAATAVPVLTNDTTAPDTGETLTITAAGPATHGTVTLTGGGTGLTYRPTPGYNGPDAFTYTVSDGKGLSDTAQVSVTVTPFDYTPKAFADTMSVPEDGEATVDVLANDTNLGNAPVTVALDAQAAHGVATVQPDFSIRYAPTANYRGSDTFRYTLTDADGDISTAAVTVTVTNVNDRPIAVADSATTAEDVSVRVDVKANDQALFDTPVAVTVTTAPLHGATTVETDGAVTFRPAADYEGEDSFEYTLTDADGETSSARVSLTITPVNDAPVATADVASTRVDEAMDIDVLANDLDVDGDPLTLVSVGAPTGGTAEITAQGKVHYTPPAGFTGTRSFTYVVSDVDGLTATGNVVVGMGLDTDADGLSDVDEVALGTDPRSKDTDEDLLTDALEVNVWKTDPKDGDVDDDGLLDGKEDANLDGTVGAAETDPTVADTDGDGLQDGTELGLAKAQGPDTDVATFAPDLDPATKTNPRLADTDNGGLEDGEEDTNGNGRVDSGETNPNLASDDKPSIPDRDGDGVPDATDNCAFLSNQDQADADGDGTGDVCEAAPPAPAPPAGGCSAAGGGAGASLLLLAGLLRRRRRGARGL